MPTSSVASYFQFTRSERRAWYVLLICNVVMIAANFFYKKTVTENKPFPLTVQTIAKWKVDAQKKENGQPLMPGLKLTPFNPNELSMQQWQQLGLNEKTAKSIRKYLEKGGRFREPNDLSKIWGLSKSQFEKLKPFVRISQTPQIQSGISRKQSGRQQFIELNATDSQQLERLPRIGRSMARRIIDYRNRLGGYVEIGQLREIWGMQDSVFEAIQPFFIVDAQKINRIDVNTATFESMRLHPYFGYRTAQAIIAYRNQHGNFKSLEEIQQIISIDEKTYRKIMQYSTLKK